MPKTAHYPEPTLHVLCGAIRDFLYGCKIGSDIMMLATDPEDLMRGSRLGTLEFKGNKMRGALALRANDQFILRTDPLKRKSLTEAEKDEWLREMINRLTGLVKGHVATHHVDFNIGLPTVRMGDELITTAQEIGPIDAVHVQFEWAQCWVFFWAVIDPMVDFSGKPDLDNLLGLPGQSFLFED